MRWVVVRAVCCSISGDKMLLPVWKADENIGAEDTSLWNAVEAKDAQ